MGISVRCDFGFIRMVCYLHFTLSVEHTKEDKMAYKEFIIYQFLTALHGLDPV